MASSTHHITISNISQVGIDHSVGVNCVYMDTAEEGFELGHV
jgi:hypothetical protein